MDRRTLELLLREAKAKTKQKTYRKLFEKYDSSEDMHALMWDISLHGSRRSDPC